MDLQLVSTMNRERILSMYLNSVKHKYDYILMMILFIIFLVSCGERSEYVFDLSDEHTVFDEYPYLNKEDAGGLIHELTSEVSFGHFNKDGTKTLYVFSSPINFLNGTGDYELIDTRLANVKNANMRDNEYYYPVEKSSCFV